jgi:Heat induced stress protein YflT domain
MSTQTPKAGASTATATATKTNNVVGVYKTHVQAEAAVKALEKAGFQMKQLSVVGRGYHTEEQPVGYYNTGDRVKHWGKLGAFWGGLWGLLFGSAFFILPGIGPVVLAGPVVAALVGGLESAALVGTLSALGAALYGIGIPKDSVIAYEKAVQADKYLLIAHGDRNQVDKARAILEGTGSERLDTHYA